MALPGSSALAATLVWTNTAGGNWKGAQNWSPNLVPGELDSAIISVPGTYTVTVSASARMASLTLGSASGLQTLSVTAGTLSVSNSGSIGTNGVLTLTAGTLGGGTMTLQGTMNWSAGTLQSALNIASGGTLNISGTSRKFLNGGQLINSGTLVWSGTGGLTFGEGGTIDNRGVFEIQNDAILVQTLYTSRPWFANSGVLRKRTATGTTSFGDVEFRNSGTVDVQSGIVNLTNKTHSFSGNTTISGAGQFQVAGATLKLSGTVSASSPLRLTAGKTTSTYTLNGDLVVTGGQSEGNITLNGNLNLGGGKDVSTATISGDLNVSGGEAAGVTTVAGNLNFSGGSLTGTITVNGNLNWSAGLLSGSKVTVQGDTLWMGGTLSGIFTIPTGRLLTIPNGANALLSGGNLTNWGTLVITNGASLKCERSSDCSNYGVVVVVDGTPLTAVDTSVSRFWNYGTLRKIGSGVTTWKDMQLSSTATIDVRDGTLSLEGLFTDSLNANSQITGAGRFMANGPTVVLGTNITCPASFELAGGTLVSAGPFKGNITWSGGALDGTLILSSERQLRFTGNGVKTLNKDAILQLSGTTILAGGSLKFFANATINNSGVFEIQNDGGFTFNATDKAWFNNTGTLRKTVSTATLPFGALQLVNSGTVDIQTGQISFTVNTHTLGNGSRILGLGALRVNGGDLTLDGTVTSSPPLDLVGGSLGGNATFTGALHASGGQALGSVTVDGPLTWSGGEIAGTLTAKQTMVWSGGTVTGTLVIPGGANLAVKPGGTRTLMGVLNNAGLVTVEPQAFLTLVSGTPLVNSGVFEVQDEIPFKLSGSSKPVFNNSGTFLKTGSSRTLALSFLLLQNSGTVDVEAGGIDFTLNSHTLANGSRLTGPGPVRVAGATVTLDALLRAEAPLELASGSLLGDATIAGNLTMSGGQLPGVVVVTNSFNWSGGEVNGALTVNGHAAWSGGTLSGALNVPASGQFDLQDGSTKLMTGTLNNHGALSLLGLSQIQMDSGAVINNAGLCETWSVSPFAHLNGGTPTFNNTGTFRKLGPGDTALTLKVIFNNSGVLDVVSNSLSFISGTHTFNDGSSIVGPGLALVDGATVNIAGNIAVKGRLTLNSGLVSGNGCFDGNWTWSGGAIAGTLAHKAGNTLLITGSSICTFNQDTTLLNAGTVVLDSSKALTLCDRTTINSSGLFEWRGSAGFALVGGSNPVFINSGTFRKTVATATLAFDVIQLQNRGVLDVQAGVLSFPANSHTFSDGSRVTGTAVTRVSGATVTLAGNLIFDAPFEFTAGTLQGTATVQGNVTWSGGTIPGGSSGSELTLNGNLSWAGGSLDGVLKGNGTVDWSDGTVFGSLLMSPSSQLNIRNGGIPTLSGILTNAGQATTVGNASLTLLDKALVVNPGVLEAQSEKPFAFSGNGSANFINSGTLRKTVSTRAMDFSSVLLQNSGTLDLRAGDVAFSANSHNFANGTHTMGAGTVRVSGGTLNLDGTSRLDAPFELASGLLSGTATINANNGMTWSGGTIPSGSGAGAFTVNGTLTWKAGSLNGNLTENGIMNWSGGLIAGTLTIPAASRLNVLPPGNGSISGVLQNSGTVIVSNNASILLLGGTPIVNSGVIEVQNELALKPNGTTKAVFINSGTFRKTTSTKLMKFDYVLLQNSGTLDVQAGELSLALNTHNFNDGTRTAGSGAVRVAGATLNVAGNLTLGPALALDSGYVAGSARLTGPFQFNGGEVSDKLGLNGSFAWSGGFLKGGICVQGAAIWTGGELDGWLLIATNSTLAIGGSAIKSIKGGALTNLGFVTVTAPLTIQADGGAEIQNYGTFHLPVNLAVTTPWGGKPTFNNYGVISLTNGFGLFTFPGYLAQFPSGRLELELAGRNAGRSFSQIIGVPNLALDGALVVRAVDGFEPVLGDRLEIIKSAQRVGTFATYSANTPRLSPDYSLTNVTLFAAAPSLTAQPQSQTVSDGTTVTFSVGAYGSQPMSYQWLWNGATLAGATNSVLTFTNVHADRETNYAVVVTNIWGSVTSTQASLTVLLLPVITQQPKPLTVLQGDDAIFMAQASGTHLSYQWKFGNDWIPGATNATLLMTDASAANAGRYKVEVSNLGGSVASAEAILTVIIPPTITEQPVGKNLNLGSSFTLNVKASGTEPFGYQWLKDGVALAGANQASFTISKMTRGLEGAYAVIVANQAGYDISLPAVLLVNTAPQITTQPLSQTVIRGANVMFSLTATGVPVPVYQWQRNGVNLEGATQPTLLLTNVQPAQSGAYSVAVVNSMGAVESVEAVLQVITPSIAWADDFAAAGILYTTNGLGRGTNCGATKQAGEPTHAGKGSVTNSVWITWWAPANGIATFSTLGSDFDTVLAVYRGTNVNALTKVAADDDSAGFHCSKVSFNALAGSYYRIAVAGVGNTCGNIILSWDLLITTELLPQITQAPSDFTGNTNDVVALQVLFTAFEPTAIQWFYQGQTLPGATNALFVIPNLQDDKVGGYAVRLTGSSGRSVVSPPGDIQINTEGVGNVAARNKFFDAAERALKP